MATAALDHTGPCRAHVSLTRGVRVLDRAQEDHDEPGEDDGQSASHEGGHEDRRKKAPAEEGSGQEGGGEAREHGQEGRAQGAREEGARPAVVTLDDVEVVGPDGKKVLPDIPDEKFEADVKADPSIEEDEKQATFVVSDADDAGEPEQQVMVAGATADPVKDYLKQIGKVPLLNAEMEVELAKRIEAGLFAEEKLGQGRQDLGQARGGARVDRRGRPSRQEPPARGQPAPRASAWPSATPAAACSSST